MVLLGGVGAISFTSADDCKVVCEEFEQRSEQVEIIYNCAFPTAKSTSTFKGRPVSATLDSAYHT